MSDITLEEFILSKKEELKRFEKTYREGMREDPEDYLSKMAEGDWDEQLRAVIYG